MNEEDILRMKAKAKLFVRALDEAAQATGLAMVSLVDLKLTLMERQTGQHFSIDLVPTPGTTVEAPRVKSKAKVGVPGISLIKPKKPH